MRDGSGGKRASGREERASKREERECVLIVR